MSDPAAWLQSGALGGLLAVIFFGGQAFIKLLDRFAGSIDKLESTIQKLYSHVQTSATAEAAAVERRHGEVLAAIEESGKETRHDIRNALQAMILHSPPSPSSPALPAAPHSGPHAD